MATALGLARLRGRTPAELADRLRQLLSRTSEQLPWWTPTGSEVLPTRRTGADAPSWPPAIAPGMIDALRTMWPGEAAALVREADAVLKGEFRLLGFDALAWGTRPDWHLEPIAQLRAPRRHWSRIPFLDASRVGDHKVVWELNRHQYLVTLAQASLVSGDGRYGDHAIELMLDWMRENPAAVGINWASSLEVGLRAISWLWTLHLLDAVDGVPAAARVSIDEGLYAHGRHLERYLSTWFSPNTHLTGEALGLLYLGRMMHGGSAPDRWAGIGRRVLARELERQVQADGTHFEQSTWYHRYTVDFYLHALALAGWSADAELPVRAHAIAMARALAHMTRPDGTIARLGDDDGGALLRLDTLTAAEVSGTLHHAALVLDLPEVLAAAGATPPSLLWLGGTDGLARVSRLRRDESLPVSVHLPDAGWHVVRDRWAADTNWMMMDAGPVGGLAGGHGHADVLSLEVWVDGAPILVDPGTGRYVGAVRDQLRRTEAHNTVTLSGASSSMPAGPFSWASRAAGRTVRREHSGSLEYIAAEHTGYARLQPMAHHARTVTCLAETGWIISDRLAGRGERAASSHFQLAAGATLSWVEGHPFIESDRSHAGRGLLAIAAAPGRWTRHPGLVSPAYGHIEPAPRLDFEWADAIDTTVILLICCARPERVLAECRTEKEVTQVDLTVGDDIHHILVNPGRERRSSGGRHTDAEVMWAHRVGTDGFAIETIPAGATVVSERSGGPRQAEPAGTLQQVR